MVSQDDIFYLGGSPCAGKSSVAEMLQADYGLNYLRLDDRLYEHIQSASEGSQPALTAIRQATCNELWLIPPRRQVERTIKAYAEEFPFHQNDMTTISRPLLVEGAGLLPRLIAPHVKSNRHVLFLVPTPHFQRTHYQQRAWVSDVLADCDDVDQAFDNWMQRDEIYARWIRREAINFGFRTLIVDGLTDLQTTAQLVSRHYGLQ